MELTDNFALHEFERSQLAARHGIDNRVPQHLMGNLRKCAEMMQRIRDVISADLHRSVSLIITSGYRCPELNALLGSKATSHHTLAAAADFVAAWNLPTPTQIFQLIAFRVDELGIGQLILEYPQSIAGGWVHASWMSVDDPADRVLVMDTRGARRYTA